jgi:hypothetical protein
MKYVVTFLAVIFGSQAQAWGLWGSDSRMTGVKVIDFIEVLGGQRQVGHPEYMKAGVYGPMAPKDAPSIGFMFGNSLNMRFIKFTKADPSTGKLGPDHETFEAVLGSLFEGEILQIESQNPKSSMYVDASNVCIKFKYPGHEVPTNVESKYVDRIAFRKGSTFKDGYDVQTRLYTDDCQIQDK